LISSYNGSGHPTNALTVSATNSTAGEAATSASYTINVTDPPAATSTLADAPSLKLEGRRDASAWLAARQAVVTVTDGDGDTASFNISNDGPSGGTLISDPPVDSKPHTIANGSTLELAGAATGKATFAGPTGSLQLNSSQAFSGKIAGFGGQDVIDLGDIAFGANTTLGYRENASDTGGTLNMSDGIHSAHIALLGNYMASSFATAGDGHGGTLITEASTAAANLQPLITVPHA